MESTISARAAIDKSCDERLDVEKMFPSLVSYRRQSVSALNNVKLRALPLLLKDFGAKESPHLVGSVNLCSDAVDMTCPLDIFFISTLLQKDDTYRNH